MDNQKVLAQVLKNLSDRWEMTVSEVAEKLNKMSEDEVKNVLEMTKLFEKGGKLNYLLCLKKGGVAECGCGCNSKVIKNQEPAEKLRARGSKPATSGIFQPKFDPENDPNWFRHNGAWVRNHFLGDDLTQFVVTDGYWGVPRKSWREIKNYNDLQRADTLNFDANGSSKNSREFIDRQNAILRGAEPQATSGAEARILNRQNGGEIQEPLPDLRYRENEVWVNDGSVDGMRHRIGNLRSAGNVSSFEPTKIGRGMGIPTQWEANGFESYVESPQDYLNRHKQFQERLKAENRAK